MRGNLSSFVGVVRCQGGAALAGGSVAVVVLSRVLPLAPVRVIGRPDVRTVVWPLVPALIALAVPIGAVTRFAAWTWVAARPGWQVRSAFIAAVAVVSTVTVAVVGLDRVVVARNLALFIGLALLGVAVLGRPPWGLLVGLPTVVWFTGVDPPDAVRWWAVPLLPADHVGAALVAGATATVGIAAHIALPPRWSLVHVRRR